MTQPRLFLAQVLRESPMIFALALMVISYGVGHRLFEFSWKGMLRISHPSTMAYQVGVLGVLSLLLELWCQRTHSCRQCPASSEVS